MGIQDDHYDPLHGRSPDYTPYSLQDLLDVRDRVNAGRFPERANAVEREIARRLSSPEVIRAARKTLPFRMLRKAVAVAEVLGGTIGAISVISVLWTVLVSRTRPSGQAPGILAGLSLMLGIYVATVYAGRELLRRSRVGVILSAIVLGLQAVSFRLFGIAYEAALPGSLYLYLRSGDLTFRLGAHWGFGWYQLDEPAFLGVNFVVLSMFGLAFAPGLMQTRDAGRPV